MMAKEQRENHCTVIEWFAAQEADIYITSNDVVHDASTGDVLFKIDNFEEDALQETIGDWCSAGGQVAGVHIAPF